jgi:hypothetical protein
MRPFLIILLQLLYLACLPVIPWILISILSWKVLGIISILGIFIAFYNPLLKTSRDVQEKSETKVGIIWSTTIPSAIIGLIITFFRTEPYDWNLVLHFVISGVIIGMSGELWYLLRRTIRRKNHFF